LKTSSVTPAIGCSSTSSGQARRDYVIGEEPVDHPLQMIELLKKKMGKKLPPREVPAGARSSASAAASKYKG
jgi:hypothetical protein